ncbi:MAG TPA: hypothetical protein VD833_10760 [Vicinamibacterales bacterium]|nr:hypothetical protein [Vicinamibacterales bacterium]
MTFANPLPWWAVAAAVVLAAALAWYAYRRVPLIRWRRLMLSGIRLVTLLLLVVLLMRPVARIGEVDERGALVPVLVDTSRSMGLEDAPGRRIDFVRRLLRDRLLPALTGRFQVDVLGFGEAVQDLDPDALHATSRRSDVQGALATVQDRYRGRPVAGIVLISDGGDTGGSRAGLAGHGPPVHVIGVGSSKPGRDREVLSVTAAEAVLDHSRIDLAASAVSHGWGRDPIQLRLLENGRPIEARRVTPAGDGVPVHQVFKVAPGPGSATVYTVEIPAAPGELVPENNTLSTLVQPPAPARRILVAEGAPGFEHSFLKRAWSSDQGLEIDSVVRKGRNERGTETFYIQAARSRSDRLRSGYPPRPEDLFAYHAVVLANFEAHQLTRAQLEATRAFVVRRGGGLLVLGARSFLPRGLADTPVEDVLPLGLSDRASDAVPATDARGLHRVALTADGAGHPIMQLDADPEKTRQRWEAFPSLAAIATVGTAKPGASVLAASSGPGGSRRALIAVQRFGEGRAMVFTGEAAWRWRMLMPSADRSYETFWRQAVRWLALPATDPVAVVAPAGSSPGENLPLRVVVRNAAFEPIRDATVDVRVTAPDGRLISLAASVDPDAPDGGRYVAHFRPAEPGVYRVTAEARGASGPLGTAATSMLAGGSDREMADPRLNLHVLRRVAAATRGRVIGADDIPSLVDALQSAAPAARLSVRRDVWHNAWSLSLLIGLLSGEWVLRRRWGLR